MLGCFHHVWLFLTLWMVVCQASLSMGFYRQEYWNGLPYPPPGDLSDPGIERATLMSPALASSFLFCFFLPLAPSGKLLTQHRDYQLLENKTIPCSYKDWITWPFKRIFPTNAHASSSGTLLHPHPHALLSKNSLCLPECAVLFQASMLWLVLCPLPGVTSLSVPVYQTPTGTLKSSLST